MEWKGSNKGKGVCKEKKKFMSKCKRNIGKERMGAWRGRKNGGKNRM